MKDTGNETGRESQYKDSLAVDHRYQWRDVSDKCLIPQDFLRRLVTVFSELLPREETGKQFYPLSLNNLEWPQKRSPTGRTEI